MNMPKFVGKKDRYLARRMPRPLLTGPRTPREAPTLLTRRRKRVPWPTSPDGDTLPHRLRTCSPCRLRSRSPSRLRTRPPQTLRPVTPPASSPKDTLAERLRTRSPNAYGHARWNAYGHARRTPTDTLAGTPRRRSLERRDAARRMAIRCLTGRRYVASTIGCHSTAQRSAAIPWLVAEGREGGDKDGKAATR
ncbi:hypothetical protein BD626DRAFT_231573 [Schizophyllum amplum]|uniref:Uncharacterized protein n=1 Tax=Schizophyllum amplum TaxID=97359 RepID=A0A550BW95_9AGAR|nr:hypothetical protein BD626DRAFT_231573 [Auriculariopsis ampla]